MKIGYRILALLMAGLLCMSVMGMTLVDAPVAVGVVTAEEPAEEPVEEPAVAEAAEVPAEEPAVAEEAEVPAAQDGGSDPVWTMSATMSATELTIQGSGALTAFPEDVDPATVSTIILGEGITSIGAGVFSECTALKKLTLPKSLVSIDAAAFASTMTITAPGLIIDEMYGNVNASDHAKDTDVNVYYRGTPAAWANVSWPDSTGAARSPSYYSASGAPVEKIELAADFPALTVEDGNMTVTQCWIPETYTIVEYLSYDLRGALQKSDETRRITVTHTDGVVVADYDTSSLYYMGETISVLSSQTADNIWAINDADAATDHVFRYSIGGTESADVKVTIIPSPVERLELVSGGGHTFVSGLDDDTEAGQFYIKQVIDDAVIRVHYNNGDSARLIEVANFGNAYYSYYDGYLFTYGGDMPWDVGEHAVTISYRGKTLDIPAKVIENPVESIRVVTPKDQWHEYTEFNEGRWSNGVFYYSQTPFLEKLTVEIAYTDGSTKTWDVSEEGLLLDDHRLYVDGRLNFVPSEDKDGNEYTGEVNNTMTLMYMGKSCTLENITVKPTAIAGVEITDVDYYYMEGSECATEWAFDEETMTEERIDVYSLNPLLNSLTLKITYTDGTTEIWDVSEKGTEIGGASLTISDNESDREAMTAAFVAGTNDFWVYLGSFCVKGQVTMITAEESPVKSVEVDLDNCVIWRGVHNILPWGAEVTITYNDDTAATYKIDGSLEFVVDLAMDVAGYRLPDGHVMEIDMGQNWRCCGTHTGTISYLGKSGDFTYTVKGGEGQDPTEDDFGIESVRASNVSEDGIGMTVELTYDNGDVYSFTLSEENLLIRDFAGENEVPAGLDGAKVHRPLAVLDGQLADIYLSYYLDDNGNLVSLWLQTENTWLEHYYAGNGGDHLQLYRAGLTATAEVTDSGSVGNIEGSYVAPDEDLDHNDETVATGKGLIRIDVTSGSDSVSNTSIRMSSDAAESLANSGDDVAVVTDVAELSFDNTTMEEIAAGTNRWVDIDVSLDEAADSAVLDVTLTVKGADGEALPLLHELGVNRSIKVRLPVPACLADCQSIYVYYQAADGALTLMPALGEEVDGVRYIEIETNHFSEYLLTGQKKDDALIRVILDYGDGSAKEVSAVASGTLPAAPEREGYEFLGWYDEDGDKVEGVTQTITLYAKWQEAVAPSPSTSPSPTPTATPAPTATPVPAATPDPAADEGIVKTGDDNHPGLWLALTVLSAAAAGIVLGKKKKA